MSPEIRFTLEEYECPATNCTETIKIKHSSKHVPSVDTDTRDQTIGINTRKTLKDCTGIDKCGLRKTHSSDNMSNKIVDLFVHGCPYKGKLE